MTTNQDPIKFLSENCTNWSLHYRDWPTWLTTAKRAHYMCQVSFFFAHGSGIGRTPIEAAQRAVRIMRVRDAKIPRPSADELKEMF